MRELSSECSEVFGLRVTSGRVVVSCVVSVVCLVALLGWVDAARSAALSTETTEPGRTTQEWHNASAFAAQASPGACRVV